MNAELLDKEDQVDHVERVEPEVLDQMSVFRETGRVDTKPVGRIDGEGLEIEDALTAYNASSSAVR